MQQCGNAAMQQCSNATMQQCSNATLLLLEGMGNNDRGSPHSTIHLELTTNSYGVNGEFTHLEGRRALPVHGELADQCHDKAGADEEAANEQYGALARAAATAGGLTGG